MPSHQPTVLKGLMLAMVAWGLVFLTGCATELMDLCPDCLQTSGVDGGQSAAASVYSGRSRVITPVAPKPAWPRSAATGRREPPLIVITYGNGCAADGQGHGLRELAEAIRLSHPQDMVITRGCDDDDDIEQIIDKHRGPVVLVGHSFGGCRSIELVGRLHRAVDWLILLDPVPCDDWAVPHSGRYFELPLAVRQAACFYRPDMVLPLSYPILNPRRTDDNHPRCIGHNDFCSDPAIHRFVLDVCVRVQNHG